MQAAFEIGELYDDIVKIPVGFCLSHLRFRPGVYTICFLFGPVLIQTGVGTDPDLFKDVQVFTHFGPRERIVYGLGKNSVCYCQKQQYY